MTFDQLFSHKPKYVKIVLKGIAYYIDDNVFGSMDLSEGSMEFRLTAHSNFVINLKTNQLIKCRWMLDDIIEKAIGFGDE